MCYDRRAGMFGVDCSDAASGELDMNITIALPQIHRTPGPLDHPGSEILVGDEEDVAIGGRSADDLLGIAACADDIGERFHAGAAIDISDDVVILFGVLCQK